ncbi:MAG: hypothetical protein IT359_15435 [Gemmatimonadaceae bacterium]|nr:hypothetical protein [Gemmatimonadaceae bacterium]
MTTLLVMTAGQTDVQVVVNGIRHELEGKVCGDLHDAIAQRTWGIVKVPTEKGNRIGTLPEGDLLLCTPKLDAVLALFGDALPSAALLFETRRTLRSDPREAGTVLERRLRERRVSRIQRVAVLEGDERLEDRLNAMDSVVRRTVVERIAEAIAAEFEAVKPERVVVATTGGLAAANAVIEELVRLHAVGSASVQVLEVPDGKFASQHDQAVPETFHPAAGYRARWHALSLVEKGDLLGAWGAVSHLEGAPSQEWTQVIKWLADFAASLPLPPNCNLAVLSHPRMAVRAALRVELALRAGDLPRAVHGTVAFFEAALWDKLLEHFERSADPHRRRYFKVKNGKAPPSDELLRQGGRSGDDDRSRPFELKDKVDGVDWYWVHDGDGGPGARIAKHFLQSNVLKQVADALGGNIRELRNDVAHTDPTPELMNEARTRMQAAKLWSSTDMFLSQPLVRDVLQELGEANSGSLLENLLAEVRGRLLALAAIPEGHEGLRPSDELTRTQQARSSRIAPFLHQET